MTMVEGSASPSTDQARYFNNIDILRGVAVLMVLWYHVPFIFRTPQGFPQEILIGTFPKIFWAMSIGGWIGVDLFFVVSGFLITSVLLRSQRMGSPLAVFWYHRALRILPLALLYLLVLGFNSFLGDPLEILRSFDGWWAYVFYIGNLHIAFHGWQPLAVMILWSLAVEQQFYLFWPVLVYRLERRKLLLLSAAVIAISPFARGIAYFFWDYPAVYVLTCCRLDGLASGVMLALLFNEEAAKDRTIALCGKFVPLAVAIISLTFIAPFSPSFPYTRPLPFTLLGYTWIAVSFAIIVGASFGVQLQRVPRALATMLSFIGKRCYGFYLWHVLVAAIVMKCLKLWSLQVGFYGEVSLWLAFLSVAAAISWSFFERPLLALKYVVPIPFYSGRVTDSRSMSLRV